MIHRTLGGRYVAGRPGEPATHSITEPLPLLATLHYVDSSFGSLGDAATYLARAELMFDLDRFDDAREEIGGALSVDPAHVPALTFLAILELQVGNNEEALTAAEAAIAAEPTHETAVLARGHALALLRRTQPALSAAEEIQERSAESWWHNVHYALIVRSARNGQDALDAAWAAVHLAPDEPRAHLALAVVSATLELDDLADRALAAATRLDPEVAQLLEGELGPNLLRGSPDKPASTRARADESWAAEPVRPKRLRWPWPLQRLLRIAAAIGVGIPVLTAFGSAGDVDAARLIAGIGAIAGAIGLVFLIKRLPDNLRDGLRVMIDNDKLFGLAVATAACGPLLSGVFALVGWIYLPAFAMLAGMATVGITFVRGRS